MYLKGTPYNCISRKASTNFRYSISNIVITLAELFSRKHHKESVWREKRMFSFDFRMSYNAYIRVWKEKGKTKNKSNMNNVCMVKDKTYIQFCVQVSRMYL